MSNPLYKAFLDDTTFSIIFIHLFLILVLNPFLFYTCVLKVKMITNLNINKSYNILSVYIVRFLMFDIVINELFSIIIVIYKFTNIDYKEVIVSSIEPVREVFYFAYYMIPIT